MPNEHELELWSVLFLVIAGFFFFMYVFFWLVFAFGQFVIAFIYERFFKGEDNERPI